MSVVHIIGDQDTVLGYRFAGVTGEVAETEQEARDAFKRALEAPDAGILLITEKVESLIQDEVLAHKVSAKPPYMAIVEDIWGAHGKRKALQDMIFEAVGIRIVSDN